MALAAPEPRSAPGIRPTAPRPYAVEPERRAPDGAARRAPRRRASAYFLKLGLPLLVLGLMFVPCPRQAGGRLQFLPVERREVRAEVEGLVEAILVREGEWVKAGQPIARIASRTHEKNLSSTQARLEEARAQLARLEAGPKEETIARALAAVRTAQASVAWSGPRARRYTELQRQKLVSDQEVEKALRQRDLDQAKLEEAQANLEVLRRSVRPKQADALRAEIGRLEALTENYRVDVERTDLTSPIDGQIVTPRVQELAGTYLKRGERDLIVQVEDARTVRAVVEVPEEDAAAVPVGSRVEVVLPAHPDQTFVGKVISTAPVIAEIPNPDGTLKTDMTGDARIAIGSRPLWNVLSGLVMR
jgi:membrane fusion protein YbhG